MNMDLAKPHIKSLSHHSNQQAISVSQQHQHILTLFKQLYVYPRFPCKAYLFTAFFLRF